LLAQKWSLALATKAANLWKLGLKQGKSCGRFSPV